MCLCRLSSQALILAPTRELAQQIQKVARALGDFLNVSSHACVGGTLVRDDIRILREGVQIVVGTPGRVYDMIKRQELSLANVKIFVLDEADEMLSRGFKDQVTNTNRRIALGAVLLTTSCITATSRFPRSCLRSRASC